MSGRKGYLVRRFVHWNTGASGDSGSGGGDPSGGGGGGDPGGGGTNSGGAGGGGGATFVESLSPEFREAIAKTGISDADGLAKAYINAQQAIGSSVRIPGPDAGPEDIQRFDAKLAEKVPGVVRLPGEGDAEGWKTFYSRLGVPEAPTAYKFAPVEGIPEQVGGNLDQWFAPIAHKANLTTAQAAAVRTEWLQSVKAAGDAAEAAQAEAAEALRGEWGAGYEQRLARALGTINPILGEKDGKAMLAEVEAAGLGNSPMLARYMERVADFISEDRFVPGQRPNLGMPDSLGEINEKIAEIQRNPAYQNSRDPLHASLVAKMENLFTQRVALQRNAA